MILLLLNILTHPEIVKFLKREKTDPLRRDGMVDRDDSTVGGLLFHLACRPLLEAAGNKASQ